MLAKFEIGRVNDTEFPPYKPDSGFYKALCKRVGQYFKEKNLNPKVRRMDCQPHPGTAVTQMLFNIFVIFVTIRSHSDMLHGAVRSFSPLRHFRLCSRRLSSCCGVLQDPIPGLWRMGLVFVTAMLSFLCTNGYWQVGAVGSVIAAIVFGVCQVSWATVPASAFSFSFPPLHTI